MKYKVLRTHIDVSGRKNRGDIIELDAKHAEALVELGLIAEYEEEKPKAKAKAKTIKKK